jgi:hypothetical protein
MSKMQEPGRIRREKKTVQLMIALYCRGHHGTGTELCPECKSLRAYALERLSRCPFAADKPTCAQCPIHCYKPGMRERIRAVMRYAGPRMLRHHPTLALLHIWDAWRTRLRPRSDPKIRPSKASSAKPTDFPSKANESGEIPIGDERVCVSAERASE